MEQLPYSTLVPGEVAHYVPGSISALGKVKSGEGYLNKVASFGLNRAYMKIRTPKSCCTDTT